MSVLLSIMLLIVSFMSWLYRWLWKESVKQGNKDIEHLQGKIKQLQIEFDVWNAIEENSWDLKCVNISTGMDDYDIQWQVIEHYQTEPHDRIIGRGVNAVDALKASIK